MIALARRDNLTVRQLAQRLGGYAGLAFVGTPRGIADAMEEWLISEGCDGFNVMFPYLPGGSTISSTRWCPNCSGADLSAANMKVSRYEKTSGCLARRTAFSPARRQSDRSPLRPLAPPPCQKSHPSPSKDSIAHADAF